MDSMRSLNTSLPKSSSRRPRPSQPSEGLQQAFRAAASSVAQLYKARAADEDTAKAAGYQEALDELLAFLDSENLGLGDGEGWRVRQWATERLTLDYYGSDSESEEEVVESNKKTMKQTSTSPVRHSSSSPEKEEQTLSNATTTDAETRNTSPLRTFQFTANTQPRDTDMTSCSPQTAGMPPPTQVRLNVRPSRRSPSRRRRSVESQGSLGRGAGLKRKGSATFDWIDFAGIGKDQQGPGAAGAAGPKRGRLGE